MQWRKFINCNRAFCLKSETIFLDATKIGDGMDQKNQETLDRMSKFWEERLLDTGKRNPMSSAACILQQYDLNHNMKQEVSSPAILHIPARAEL